MAASLDEKEVDALIEKYRALAAKEQRRADELEESNEHLLDALRSSVLVPASAYGLSYARAYYGERASILGIPIDAAIGILLKGIAALLGFFSDKGAQVAAKVAHDVANGAFASWGAAAGAELGLKKRMEKPVPVPLPNTGATETPPLSSRAMTHEDLAAIKAGMALNTQPAMAGPPPTPAPWYTPAPMPVANPVQETMAAANASAQVPQLPTPPQPTPHPKPFRFTQRWSVDPEADMRALLQSVGAPADPNTVNHVLSHENPGDEFKVILRRARAPDA